MIISNCLVTKNFSTHAEELIFELTTKRNIELAAASLVYLVKEWWIE